MITDYGPRTNMWHMTKPEKENAATFLEFTSLTPFTSLQGSYKCLYCHEISTELHPILQHTKTHAIPTRAIILNTLRKGKRVIKVDASDLKCRLCELKYSELDDVRNHLTVAHKKVFNKAGNGLMLYNLSTASGNVACHKCGLEFPTFFSLNRHMNTHDNLVCEVCGTGFMTRHRLRNHSLIHQNGVHKCDLCQKIFRTKLKLRYHTFKNHEVTNVKKLKPLKCPHCLERFSEQFRKLKHLQETHGVTFEFACHTCKAVYSTKRALREHTRKVHLQNILCKVCGECFGNSDALRRHMRRHTGERNFVCAVCQKAYKHERDIRKHMKSHGFMVTCLECGNGFRDKIELNKHQKQWHSEQESKKA